MEDANQYCPVAIATEIVADRWTPLILREFIVGAHTFSEIQNGIPRISRSLLSDRLRQLVANGLIIKTEEQAGRPRYSLTPAGEDLQDFVFGLGEWAIRWAYFSDPADDQLDNTHLIWRFRRGVLKERVPNRRVVVEFVLDCPRRVTERIWLVIEPGDVDACVKHPGFDVDLEVRTTSRELHRVWMGRTSIPEAIRTGTMQIDGAPALVRAFPRWFSFSPFAPVIRRSMQPVG
ncbi:MAG: winged helix-turn-helix transcriptional regulator [Dehalococcoidia bacterium]